MEVTSISIKSDIRNQLNKMLIGKKLTQEKYHELWVLVRDEKYTDAINAMGGEEFLEPQDDTDMEALGEMFSVGILLKVKQ